MTENGIIELTMSTVKGFVQNMIIILMEKRMSGGHFLTAGRTLFKWTQISTEFQTSLALTKMK